MKKKNIFLAISIVMIILILVFLNYDNILKWRYNNAVKNKDCEKIYNIVDVENGEYLSKEKYIEQCNLKVKTYVDNEVIVEKHKIKDNIVNVYNNVIIYIPSDSDFYLDGKLISSKFTKDEKGIYKIFTFDKLFEGEYSIKFNNKTNDEHNTIMISEDNLKQIYEYNNAKQKVIIINNNSCSHCSNLVRFLSTLDKNIFDIKYYDDSTKREKIKKEFLNYFETPVKFYPTVIIGDKYIVGYSDAMDNEYVELIYSSYRNEIETVIK